MNLDNQQFRNALLENIQVWNQVAGRLPSSFPIDAIDFLKHFHQTDHILDYGCGRGRAISFLRKRGFKKLTGCDTSIRMCDAARLQNPESEIIWLETPEKNSLLRRHGYDGLIAIGVLSSIIPVGERYRLVEQWANLVTRTGRIILGDFGFSVDPLYLERYEAAILEPRTFETEDGLMIHHFTLDELEELLSRFFRIIESRTLIVETVHRRRIPGHVIVAVVL